MTEKKLDECPCGSKNQYTKCCEPYIKGKKSAETALDLLKSRYSAFAKHEVDYILKTHHPEKSREIDPESIKEWAEKSVWHGLEIIASEQGQKNDDEGVVEFMARYTQDGRTYNHHEVSLFKKHDGDWKFFDVKKNKPVKTDGRVGRNDPCFCGSGKKFKKCHAAAA